MLIKRLSLALVAATFALVSFADAQTVNFTKTVKVDPTGQNCSPNTMLLWTPVGMPYTCKNGKFGAAGNGFVSIPLTLTQLQTLNTVGVQILPAFGAGTLTELTSCVLDLKFGSAAFTGGGTVTIGYGATSAVTAGAATIASTVFTTFTASQSVLVAGSLAVSANTLTLNLPIWINAASADFAAGTGATGVLDCGYRVHYGF